MAARIRALRHPCKEPCEPGPNRVEELEQQLADLKAELELLRTMVDRAETEVGELRHGEAGG